MRLLIATILMILGISPVTGHTWVHVPEPWIYEEPLPGESDTSVNVQNVRSAVDAYFAGQVSFDFAYTLAKNELDALVKIAQVTSSEQLDRVYADTKSVELEIIRLESSQSK